MLWSDTFAVATFAVYYHPHAQSTISLSASQCPFTLLQIYLASWSRDSSRTKKVVLVLKSLVYISKYTELTVHLLSSLALAVGRVCLCNVEYNSCSDSLSSERLKHLGTSGNWRETLFYFYNCGVGVKNES